VSADPVLQAVAPEAIMNPTLVVTVPRAALPIDGRHHAHLSTAGFVWQLQERLSGRLGVSVVATVTDGWDFRVDVDAPPTTPIDSGVIGCIDDALDDLLSDAPAWRTNHDWSAQWEAPDPWNPWYQQGQGCWGEVTIDFDVVIRRDTFALLVGYWAAGAANRKWYRCHFPAEHPDAEAVEHAILRSVMIWLQARWPEGPNERS
jgi:hypothetical protein